MKKTLVALALYSLATASLADTATVEFTHAGTSTGSFSEVASQATLDLSLNPDGTIAATLSAGAGIIGFGFNGGGAPTPPGSKVALTGLAAGLNPTTWSTWWGTYDSGFFYEDYMTNPLSGSYSFTIGTTGQFTSVLDTAHVPTGSLPGGGAPTQGRYWVALYTGNELYFAGDPDGLLPITPTNPVPEPETYALLLAGLGLLTFGARRRATA